MIPTKVDRVAFYALLCAAMLIGSTQTGGAKESSQSPRPSAEERSDEETNLDTQLHLILATNQSTADNKIPASLDPVVRQLRATLPFKNYALAASLLHRVKNGW